MPSKKIINLIPKQSAKAAAVKAGSRRAASPRSAVIRNIVLLLALPVGFGAWQIVQINKLQNELKTTQDKMKGARAGLTQTQAQSLQLEKQKSDLLKELESRKLRLEQLLSTTSAEKDYAAMLSELVGFMPKELWFGQIVLTDSQMQLTGSALNPELVVELTNQMDGSGALKNSVFTSSERQTVQSHVVYNFKITAEPVWSGLKKGDVSL